MQDILEQRTTFGEESNLWPPNSFSVRLEASRVIKTGTARLYGLTVTNTKNAAQFVLIFDAQTLPADGAVPIFAKSVPSQDAVGFAWLPGRTFFAGIIVCKSSTQTTTPLGSADCLFDAQYD